MAEPGFNIRRSDSQVSALTYHTVQPESKDHRFMERRSEHLRAPQGLSFYFKTRKNWNWSTDGNMYHPARARAAETAILNYSIYHLISLGT